MKVSILFLLFLSILPLMDLSIVLYNGIVEVLNQNLMKYLSYCHNTMRLFYVFKKLFLKLDDIITLKGYNIYNHILLYM